jgi:hypothetical protein
MSTEVSDDVKVESPVVSNPDQELIDRVHEKLEIGSAVRSYLRDVKQFERASKDFSESCQALRAKLKPNSRFVYRMEYGSMYLVTSDSDGNFNVEPVDSL